jgi:hypothetical protein
MNTKLTKLATMGAAATAIGAVGFFTVPAPAQAAPPCDKYGFALGLDLLQSNGFSVSVSPDAKNTSAATGTASSANNNGTVSGGVNGRSVDFTIHWNGGAQGHYTGTVSDDGNVHGGATVDVANPGSGASWDSTTPFVCLDAPAPAPAPDQVPLPRQGVPITLPQAPPPPPPNVATVLADNNVYDKINVPEGRGHIIGMLQAGRQVEVQGTCTPGDVEGKAGAWNQVVVPDMPGGVPPGTGYAWGFITCP